MTNGKMVEVVELPYKIELQNFSDDGATDVDVADPQPDVQGDSVIDTGAADQKPVQDADTNTQFAKVRRDAETKARDAVIAEMGYEYNGKPITTYEQYKQALAEAEAEKQRQAFKEQYDIDPEVIDQRVAEHPIVKKAAEFVTNNERKDLLTQQEVQLENDPKTSEFYKQWKDEIHKFADENNVDYDVAFTFISRQKLPEIAQRPDVEKIKQEGIKEYIDGLKRGNKPIEGSGATPVVVSEPKTFEDARNGALAYLRAQKQT